MKKLRQTSKIERSAATVNDLPLLTIVAKRYVLDFAGVVDTPLVLILTWKVSELI